MSLDRSSSTEDNKPKKKKQITFVATPASSTLSSTPGGFCSANQCGASSPPQGYIAQSAFGASPRAPRYYNSSTLESKDDHISANTTQVSYASLAKTSFAGSLFVTFTTNVLSDSLEQNFSLRPAAQYLITQIPRAAFMCYMNASIGTIIVAPAMNYALINFGGVSEYKASLATTVITTAVDVFTTPTSILLTGIASGMAGGMAGGKAATYIGNRLFSNSKNIVDKAFDQAKKTQRLVLISVKMTHCKPCQKMEIAYHDTNVNAIINERYVRCKIDLSKDAKLAESLGVEEAPTTIVLDANRNIINTIKGKHSAEDLAKKLEEINFARQMVCHASESLTRS